MSAPGEGYGQWNTGAQALPPPKPKNGMGVAALVFGILAVLTFWLPIVGLVLGLIAVVFGVVGRGRVRAQRATNGGMALTGLILGLLVFLVNAVLSIALFLFGFAFINVGGGNTLEQFQQCISQARSAPNPAAVQQAAEQCAGQFGQQLPSVTGGQ
ncbi:DUF4190 domain-containing protein [Actinomycetospora sp.]|uniref:DUF4190 domain-containing protein n=1 Tax=Actinomycetospora sp. TaxID=1872135 RepID=UPI002F4123DB